jgi:hypothetical protein
LSTQATFSRRGLHNAHILGRPLLSGITGRHNHTGEGSSRGHNSFRPGAEHSGTCERRSMLCTIASSDATYYYHAGYMCIGIPMQGRRWSQLCASGGHIGPRLCSDRPVLQVEEYRPGGGHTILCLTKEHIITEPSHNDVSSQRRRSSRRHNSLCTS